MKAFAALAVTLSAVTALLTALLTACSTVPSSTVVTSATPNSPRVGSAPQAGSTPRAASARVFGRIFHDPAATVTGGRLYVTWQVNSPTAAVPQFELARVNQVTGAIAAVYLLVPGQVGAPLVAGGSLWVPVARAAGESLLRLNPQGLAETGNVAVSGGSDESMGRGSHLAVAGDALWVAGGDRLLRVSLVTGQVIASIPLPGAATSGVAANGTGTTMVVSEANDSGVGSVQRRDPVTGALLASHPMLGVAASALDGIIDSGVWLSEPTGLLGYVERFRTVTMAPDPATDVGGDNGINAVVADGVVWITDPAAPGRDYCADPVTGRVLARVRLPDPRQDDLVAVSRQYLYYDSPASSGFYLSRVPVPGAC